MSRKSYDLCTALPVSGISVDAADGVRVGARRSENPPPAAGPGHSGHFVKVTCERSFAFATLRFLVPRADVSHLHPESILAARWVPDLEQVRIIPASGFNRDGGYVFSRITRPGLYTAVGVPRDPTITAILRLALMARYGAPFQSDAARALGDEIGDAGLDDDTIKKVFGDQPALRQLGLYPEGLPHDLEVAECLRLLANAGLHDLPEGQALELLDVPAAGLAHDMDLPAICPAPSREWHSLGPINVSGRVVALAIDPRDSSVIFAGTAGGGVWKTSDGGGSWSPTMHREGSLAIGGLGMAASCPDILYAATGEWTGGIGWPRNPAVRGEGVYRTSDGGRHWQSCAPIASDFCSAVAVDPRDPDRVFVAGDKGLHRSGNGGFHWDVPKRNAGALLEPGGDVSDVVIDADDPNRIYVGVHNVGVYRSLDGGDTWSLLENGLETGETPIDSSFERAADAPRVALGRGGRHRTRFVAVKMGNRIFTSTNGGDSFVRCPGNRPESFTRVYGWCNVIAVDPTDESILFAGAVELWRSRDGGKSWNVVSESIHGDQQNIAFDPHDHDHLYLVNDGGVWRSTDKGCRWKFLSRGLVAGQFYNVGVSQTRKLCYGGAMHDESAHVFDGRQDWRSLALFEGGYVEYDPNDEGVIYHDTTASALHRIDCRKGWEGDHLGIDTSAVYSQPIAIARGQPVRILAIESTSTEKREVVRNQVVRYREDPQRSWQVVLPSATAPFTAVAFAPSDSTHAYIGSADGRVWQSIDGGGSWRELGASTLRGARIDLMAIDWADPLRLYLAVNDENLGSRLFRGDLAAAGEVDWFAVSGSDSIWPLADRPITGLALHPTQDDVVFATGGTDMLRSIDGGFGWEQFDRGFPRVYISDLKVRKPDHSLFASTLGRGLYRRFV